jgi:formate/nitrite transporter
MLLHWFVTFWGNLAGSLFVVAIIFGCTYRSYTRPCPSSPHTTTPITTTNHTPFLLDGEVFSADPFRSAVISFATKKQVTPDFHHIFLRGIGCNWLVCLACFLALQGRDMASKIIGIWLPIYAFVSLGFDHVVANMTFIPMAIWLEAPGISVGLYVWKGVIPTLLGNIVGGGLFVGEFALIYTWLLVCLWGAFANAWVMCCRHVLLVHVPSEERPRYTYRSAEED